MKGFAIVGQFAKLGIALLLLLTARLAMAQTNGAGDPTLGFTVSITSPEDGADFPTDTNISITAVARGSLAAINEMSLYAGTNLLVTRVIDPILPLNGTYTVSMIYDWTNVPAGSYSVTAVAHNTAGRSATSGPVNITVGPIPPGLPVVNIIATDPIAVAPGGTGPIIMPLIPSTPFTNYIFGTNTATFLVRRIGPSVVSTNALTVFYNLGGTASNGVDYVALPGDVTIGAGSNYALITVIPLAETNKTLLPPFKTVVLTLNQPPGESPGSAPTTYAIGWPGTAGAIIFENGLRRGPSGPIGPPIAGPIPIAPFHVSFPGTNGMIYCLDVSSNLNDWQPVCTNVVVKGWIEFLDPESGNCSNRFYRARSAAALPSY